eukprot:20082-Heterococcus_DN1.PRE.1
MQCTYWTPQSAALSFHVVLTKALQRRSLRYQLTAQEMQAPPGCRAAQDLAQRLFRLSICMLQQITCLRVTFVGAGPGTSALLTEAAKAALQQAQLVVADIGVHESVLKLAASAHVSKLSAPANAMDYLQQFSSDGHDVVRLLVGDPYMS